LIPYNKGSKAQSLEVESAARVMPGMIAVAVKGRDSRRGPEAGQIHHVVDLQSVRCRGKDPKAFQEESVGAAVERLEQRWMESGEARKDSAAWPCSYLLLPALSASDRRLPE
jgi:hypothetical protein